MLANLGPFVLLSILLVLTPGPDTAIVVRNSLWGGRRAGALTALGVCSGLLLWTLAASAGVAALLRASAPAFALLRLLGAAYLIYLGVQALRAAIWGEHAEHQARERRRADMSSRVAFRQGLLTNLSNPKIAVFFTTFLPQFLPGRSATFASLLLLGMVFSTLGLLQLTGYALLVARAGDVFKHPRVQRTMSAVTGLVLVGFSVRLALDSR